MPFPEEPVLGWGMSSRGSSFVARPRDVPELRRVLETARDHGLSVGLRGAGCSYGDAAINDRNVVIDACALNRILDFDAQSGVLRAEPGVTIEQVWRHALPRGFWPPVVPGTMFPTLGGCAAMNIHGKNNFCAGSIGEHVLRFDLMLSSGETMTCSREENADVFHAAIGGIGMLGIFTSLTLRLARVHSGDLWVRPIVARNLSEMVHLIEERQAEADYLVGWLDAFASGSALGRGLIHEGRYLRPGEDDAPEATLRAEHQVLPSRFFGVLPKSWMWTGLWCFLNRPGMRLVNACKYHQGARHARHGSYRQALVAFSFLLDYVPNWKYAYKPGGLIQYQSFIPAGEAVRVFRRLLELSQQRGILPYLGVLKKHRPDPFLMTHAVDGYSLALDFPVRSGTRARVWELAAEMDRVVTEAGGRFYFAKDSTMTVATLRRAYPAERLERFLALKRRLDPCLALQTDLFRRLFMPILEGAEAPTAAGA